MLLLERADALGTGSTGACAGGFRHQFSSRINVELSLASVPMIVGFSEEHGLPLDVARDGYLFLVRTEGGWAAFREAAALQCSLGVDAQLLTPQEAAAIAPGIAVEGLVGATFCSGRRDRRPRGLTQGYATAARRAGAEIVLGTDDGDRGSRWTAGRRCGSHERRCGRQAGGRERCGSLGRRARGIGWRGTSARADPADGRDDGAVPGMLRRAGRS